MPMLTSRTPLRVSLFGGGTDYPEYFSRYPGAVLGTAIDKYIYISCLRLERFVGFGYRLSYRINEEVQTLAEMQHPVFRTVLGMHDIGPGWNFSSMSSLPSNSGLGSSSSFTVGLINLVSRMKNLGYTRYDLASMAIDVEREKLKEIVGIQDQLHAAFGSLNRYDFTGNDFTITPVRLKHEVRDALNNSMYLVHTGIERHTSQTVDDQVQKTKDKVIDKPLEHMYNLVGEAQKVLEKDDAELVLREIGRMLDDGWQTKRSLSAKISNPEIDAIYATAMQHGALGGKLCGAGGGGFFLLLIPHHARNAISEALGHRELIPIRMDDTGSTIINV